MRLRSRTSVVVLAVALISLAYAHERSGDVHDGPEGSDAVTVTAR